MLEIKDLHVKFHTRDREAVAGVSLTIHDGEILGLVGESGSGKSVTAMSVAGLLPRRSCDYSGQVLLDGTRPYFDKAVFHAARGARFELASLGNDAGAYGAFKLALDAFGK